LFCARDRFGVKPFYYFSNDTFFAFSSEIKQLLHLYFVPKELNNEIIYDYLVWGMLEHSDETFIKNIKKLLPGYTLTLNIPSKKFELERYFTPSLSIPEQPIKDNWKSELLDMISNSIRIRLRSDVPVGTCLSGGLDSSTIVCISNKLIFEGDRIHPENLEKRQQLFGKKQKVFTSSFQDKRFDESEYAKEVVEWSGASWHRVFPNSKELLSDLDKLIWHQDEPFGSTSIYAQFRVMKLAAENGIKVILDGQGGDELFAGYIDYYTSFFLEIIKKWNIPGLFNAIKAYTVIQSKRRLDAITLILKGLIKQVTPLYLKKCLLLKKSNVRLINKDFYNMFRNRIGMFERNYFSLNETLLADTLRFSLPRLLRYEDRNSMAFSIEARVPFTDDHILFDYVLSMPSDIKINQGWTKHLLREAVKGIIPERVRLRRDKMAFAIPEKIWLREIKEDIKGILLSEPYSDFLDNNYIRKNIHRILNTGPETGLSEIWFALNLKLWQDLYLKRFSLSYNTQ